MRRVAVYAATRNMYKQMAAAAKSLLSHTHMDLVWFLIEDDEFPEQLPDVIQTINVSDQEYFPPDGANAGDGRTYMSLMRLVLPELLWARQVYRNAPRKVLWLDIDTIVEKDIGTIFETGLYEHTLAMVEEPARSMYPFKYHNAGVILMDLQNLWDEGTWVEWVDLCNRQKFTAQEQDVINILSQGRIKTLGPEWNTAGVITQDHPDPYIRHYAGYLKPAGEARFRELEKAEWRVI